MRRLTIMMVLVAAVLTGLAGCGGSSSSSGPNKADFCAANAKLDKATSNVTSVSGLITVFKDNKSTIQEFIKNAPSNIKAQAQVLANAANSAIKSGNASSFQTPKLASAGQSVDKYCGQSASSST
jgi:hypothetical protein